MRVQEMQNPLEEDVFDSLLDSSDMEGEASPFSRLDENDMYAARVLAF